jgi:D-glycero-D-manno-heptose 1,7-bisphosphate phosphatase
VGAGKIKRPRAIFLDRDGVLNYNVLNPLTSELEAPLTPEDFRLIPGVLESLGILRDSGFLLFLVSNQPNYAKGKVTLDALEGIHNRLESALDEAGIAFKGFNYCLHHPQAVVPSLLGPCQCRKPSPHFLLKAQNEHAIDLSESWMIGDRVTDVQCGKAAGVRTIRIVDEGAQAVEAGESAADFTVTSLASAVRILLANNDSRSVPG